MKTVLITGASRGIGREIAKQFAADGCGVIINYNKNYEAAESLLNELKTAGGLAIALKADISDEYQVKGMFKAAYKNFKTIDVLINNAGIAEHKLFTDITAQGWQKMFDVNVMGTFLCCREALPQMIDNKSGCIINISSIWGITGASCEVHYSASKAAVIGLTKALAKEVGLSGINVNCIAPGVIETDMIKDLSIEDKEALKQQTALNCLGNVSDIASLALYLASDKAKFITGQVISPNGGFLI